MPQAKDMSGLETEPVRRGQIIPFKRTNWTGLTDTEGAQRDQKGPNYMRQQAVALMPASGARQKPPTPQ